MAAEIDVLKAQIVRNDVNTPWGFRLSGGADFGEPLKILRVRGVGCRVFRIAMAPVNVSVLLALLCCSDVMVPKNLGQWQLGSTLQVREVT